MITSLQGPILFVGAGKMGGAMLMGLLEENDIDPAQIIVQDPDPQPFITDFLAKYEIEAVSSVDQSFAPEIVILAVKPQLFDSVLPSLTDIVKDGTLVLSVAAGKTIASIESYFGPGKPIVRAMPNTPAQIGLGITALYPNQTVNLEHKELVEGILGSVGETLWCSSEDDLDIVTALSGSGPAYVFLLTESMAKAAIDLGLGEDAAWQLAKATVSGAGQLMQHSEDTPATLRENVTSPGGTTAAALSALMDQNELGSLMHKAIQAAKDRSKELSG